MRKPLPQDVLEGFRVCGRLCASIDERVAALARGTRIFVRPSRERVARYGGEQPGTT